MGVDYPVLRGQEPLQLWWGEKHIGNAVPPFTVELYEWTATFELLADEADPIVEFLKEEVDEEIPEKERYKQFDAKFLDDAFDGWRLVAADGTILPIFAPAVHLDDNSISIVPQ